MHHLTTLQTLDVIICHKHVLRQYVENIYYITSHKHDKLLAGEQWSFETLTIIIIVFLEEKIIIVSAKITVTFSVLESDTI